MKNGLKILNIALVLLSMLTIFLFSSENSTESSKTSKTVAREIVDIVVKDKSLTDLQRNKIADDNMKVVRKVAHFLEFFILGFLLVNLLKDYSKVTWLVVITCLSFACFYACTDELHQLFVSGRSGQVMDVGVDTLGSTLGIMTYCTIYDSANKFRKRMKKA